MRIQDLEERSSITCTSQLILVGWLIIKHEMERARRIHENFVRRNIIVMDSIAYSQMGG
jgi:hypothetical protein